jgi:type VI secretion system secreted protein VgrG
VSSQNYTQANRLIAVDTPLGPDVLLLQSLAGYEGISRLFSYELDLLAYDNDSISFQDIVGQKVSITLHLPDGTPRYISGYVSLFTQGETDERQLFTNYHAQVVPWLWFLTHQADCRIFQNLAAPDIISQVFNLSPFNDFRLSLQDSYPQLEYCVQYRESSFNFVSRLMEEFGIFYYFDHSTPGKHTLVLADQSNALPACPSSPVSYATQVGGLSDPEVIIEWHLGQEVCTGKHTVTDYNFTTPSTSLLASDPTVVSLSASQGLEIFDYPGPHTTKDEGDKVAKVRMQEEETSHLVMSGGGDCRGLMSGCSFVLKNHYRADQNATYIVTEVHHFASAGESYTTDEQGSETYSNHFTCIPASVVYRPPRVTPKPFIQGPQPALVVGKQGEEIWVDKYGRVVVQFYWDRLGQKNENSSCWIRTSQPWAGGDWGAVWIPRIGQEVLVSFLEGDPDRPVITGRVYNADQMPPYDLPQYQTRSTFKSRSSKGGGQANYNELRFEDKMGSEQIFINAEKDMDLRVEHDSREYVMNDRHLLIDGNQFEKVKGNKDAQVGGDHKEKVGGDVSLDVGGSRDEKVGTKHAVDSGQEIHLKAGMKVIIEGGMQVSLKGPGGFVDIGPSGVTIQGTMVLINSGGSAGSGSGSNPKSPKDPDTADDGSKGTKM